MSRSNRLPSCLTLVRHAHAEPALPGANDFDRALTARGREQARLAAVTFSERDCVPDCIIASPARRALQTAEIFADLLLGSRHALSTDPRVYQATVEQLLQIVGEFTNSLGHLMIVGHNPGISELARAVSQDSGLAELATAGVFVHRSGTSATLSR